MSTGDKNDWNKDILPYPSFLQSRQWGEVQEKLGRRVFLIKGEKFAAMAVEQNLPLGQKYIYVPHGPVLRGHTENALRSFAEEIKKIAGKDGAVFARIEPLILKDGKVPEKFGFRKTKPVQPQTTLTIDLGKTEEEMLSEMEHDTRYSIRTAEKRGVTVRFYSGKEEKKKIFPEFWKMFSETNERHSLKHYPEKYYREVASMEGECSSKIAIAEADGKAVSGAIFVYFGDRMFYLFAASRAGYGKFNAPTYLIWRAMLDAKKSGYGTFDMWGISHENKKWAKITAFKKSFGGSETGSIGAWDMILDKPRYAAYKAMRFFFR